MDGSTTGIPGILREKLALRSLDVVDETCQMDVKKEKQPGIGPKGPMMEQPGLGPQDP